MSRTRLTLAKNIIILIWLFLVNTGLSVGSQLSMKSANIPRPHPAARPLPPLPPRVVTGRPGGMDDVTDAFRSAAPVMESI